MRSKEDIEIDVRRIREEYIKEKTRHEKKMKVLQKRRNRLECEMQLATDNYYYFIHIK